MKFSVAHELCNLTFNVLVFLTYHKIAAIKALLLLCVRALKTSNTLLLWLAAE